MTKLKPADEWTRADKDAARAILLEASPYAVDGGELIGRDPRAVSVDEFASVGIDGAAILAVIRAKCFDCCVHQADEVRKCVAVACPNWPFRMGTNPFRAPPSEAKREQARQMAERRKAARAAAGGENDPIDRASSASDDPGGL